MNPGDTHTNYLRDLGYLVKEYMYEAKKEYLEARGTPEENFASGYFMGLRRIVTLMQQQADAFDIPAEHICLADVDEAFFWTDEIRKL